MELRHLRYFLTVAEEGHVTRAAERLGIQQPPLSQQIGALERELGARLFDRKPRGVALTDVGAAFREDARRILEQVEQAVARVRRVARGEEGRLAVGFVNTALFHPMIRGAIRAFRAQYPDVALDLREMGSFELAQALTQETLDVAFIRTSAPAAAGLAIYDLFEDAMTVALPQGHPLATSETEPLALAQLQDAPFVLYRRASGPGLYDRIIAACHAAGFAPRIEQEAPRAEATLNLVAAGLGVSIVPESFHRLHMEDVMFRPLAHEPRLTAPMRLACRRNESSTAARRFVAFLRERAAMEASEEMDKPEEIAKLDQNPNGRSA